MTAAFRLDFAVGSIEPLQQIRSVLVEINGSLAELARAANPFDEMQQPVARATEGVTGLNEVLSETGAVGAEAAAAVGTIGETAGGIEAATAAVTGLDETLTRTTAAAAEAGSGMNRIGTEAEEAADRSVSALGRIRSAASALGSGGMGYARGVGGAVRGFGQSIQEGVGSAFGAAATGFGIVMPVRAAAEYDNDLTHIGIGLNLHGQDNVNFASAEGRRLELLARQTGQRSDELAAAEAFLGREGYTGDRLHNLLPDIATIGTAYNARPDAVARTAFSMQQNIGIKDQDLRAALASASVAGKLADMPMEELAPLFPELGAAASGMKVHGRQGLDDILAALAVSRKSAGSLGMAVHNEEQFIAATTSNAGEKNFLKLGIDIRKYRADALRKGIDPFEATLKAVDLVTHRGQNEEAMATLFHNVMDKTFATAMMQHITGDPAHGEWGYLDVKKRLGQATSKDVTEDFDTGINSTKIVLQGFEEALSQLERRIGHGFVPILKVATSGLHGLTGMFEWLDDHVPGASTAIIGTAGGMLALATGMGAVGAVAGPLRAGFTLFRAVLLPIGGLLGGVSLATVGVVAGLAALTVGVVAAALYVSRNLTRISHAFDAGGSGITGALKGTWNVAKMVFNDFTTWLDSWGGGIGTKLHNIVTGLAKVFSVPLVAMFQYIKAQFAALDQAFSNSWVGRHVESLMGRGVQPAPAIPAAAPARPAASGGQFGLHVSHDPGLKIRQTAGAHGAVRITPDRGKMVAQP